MVSLLVLAVMDILQSAVELIPSSHHAAGVDISIAIRAILQIACVHDLGVACGDARSVFSQAMRADSRSHLLVSISALILDVTIF